MSEHVIIIGAGFSGLAAAYELKQRGIKPKVLDAASAVASSWRRRHDALSLNTHRWHSSQTDFPMPRHFGAYPSRKDYVSYLEDYVAFLDTPIDWNVRVTKVSPNPDGRWTVTADDETLTANHVIIATGPDAVPYFPDWPGRDQYQGELIHAAHFTKATDYEGKKVLIVGAGNSGFDIGNHLITANTSGWMSVRSGQWVAPKYIMGIPGHLFAVWNRHLPLSAQDKSVAVIERLFIGNLRKIGMPEPDYGVCTRQLTIDGVTGAVDDGFAKALKSGHFNLVPPIQRFDANQVILEDGQQLAPDAVIAATGYRPGLETMVGHLDVLGAKGKPNYDDRLAAVGHRGLWFLGYNVTIYGNQFIRRDEAKRLADNIAA